MGALRTVTTTQLVRAGVGFVRLIDRDVVEPSNLQRQSLYDEQDAQMGRAKAEAAAQKLKMANGDVAIEALTEDVTWRNAEHLLSDVDVIVDGTDNFRVRYLTQNHEPLSNSVGTGDVWNNEFHFVRLGSPKKDCPCCARHQFSSLEARTDGLTVSRCGRQTVQVHPSQGLAKPLAEIADRLKRVGDVRHNGNLLRLDLGDVPVSLFTNGRALIHGVEDEAAAKSIYSRYIGW